MFGMLFDGTRSLKVRKPTDFGFVLDDMGNMPAMVVDATRIRGTDATVEVRYVFGKTFFVHALCCTFVAVFIGIHVIS